MKAILKSPTMAKVFLIALTYMLFGRLMGLNHVLSSAQSTAYKCGYIAGIIFIAFLCIKYILRVFKKNTALVS
jgi:hypothetical protein